jgi:hypothetical protein
MSIKCQVCQEVFAKIIPWQHLRKHNLSSEKYKEQYGSLYSEETLALFKARTPHNKGKKVVDSRHLEKINQAIKKREQRYHSGELQRHRTVLSDETREKISLGVKKYAIDNLDKLQDRAKKAQQTKKIRGIKGPMLGRRHNEKTKEKLRQILQQNNQKKKQESWKKISAAVDIAKLKILSDKATALELECQVCYHQFQITKQYFNTEKFRPNLCPKCFPAVKNKTSKGEQELFHFIQSISSDCCANYRSEYQSLEIDIFVPSKQIGFEYNGLYWHSESVFLQNNRNPKSDYEKYLHFKNNGIQIIQIYEDEWLLKKHIVKSRIRHILGQTSNKIYARQCKVKYIDSKTAGRFFNETHIMGNGRSNYRLGLFYQDRLVSAMSFSKNNLSRKITGWELNRFSSECNLSIVGAASKLFKTFIKDICPDQVISYSDNRWSMGNLYQSLGFEFVSLSSPNYWYFLPNHPRIHRFNLRKNQSDNPNMSEVANRISQGYNRIWDSGSTKWLWTNKKGDIVSLLPN